jgi:hypothetical protein
MAGHRTLNLDDQGLEDYLGEVKVGGKSYQVLAPTSLGLVGMARIEGFKKRMEKAQVALSENAEDETALATAEACLNGLVLAMLEWATPEIVKGMRLIQKVRLVDFVSGLLKVESEQQPEPVALVEASPSSSAS